MSDDFQRGQLEYYDKSAEAYEAGDGVARTLNRAFERKSRILLNSLGPGPWDAVFEVGAGSGLLTWYVAKGLRYARYVALDLSQAMLDLAKRRLDGVAKVEFLRGDAAKTGLPSNSATAVIGCDIIHHLEHPVEALAEWHRVAKPGGKLVVLETNPKNPLHWRFIGVEHEVRSWLNTDTNLKRWVEEAGWKNVQVVEAPVFTPAGPRGLGWLLDALDQVSLWIPGWRRLTAMWVITAEK